MWSAWRTVETRCEIRITVRPRITPASSRENPLFGEGIDARKGVVQNQNPRVAQDGAGDGGALLLPARKGDAALADHGLVAFGKTCDIARQPGDFGGAADLLRGGRFHAEGDVLRDGGAEQESLLRHEADLPAQFAGVEFAHVHAVHQHRAGGGIHQARHQADQRALARPGVAHHRDGGAGGNAQIDAVQGGAHRYSPRPRREIRSHPRAARMATGRAGAAMVGCSSRIWLMRPSEAVPRCIRFTTQPSAIMGQTSMPM